MNVKTVFSETLQTFPKDVEDFRVFVDKHRGVVVVVVEIPLFVVFGIFTNLNKMNSQ